MRHGRRVRIAYSALLCLISLSLLAGQPIPARANVPVAAEPASTFVAGEVLVAFRPGSGGAPLSDVAKDGVLRALGGIRAGTVYGDIAGRISGDTTVARHSHLTRRRRHRDGAQRP